MKLPESAAFELFKKHGILFPRYFVAPPTDRDFLNSYLNDKFVVKANVPVGGKKKSGLVQISDSKHLNGVIMAIMAQAVPDYKIDSVIVEEFVEHKDEYFISLKAVREGVEVYYSGVGGIDVEQNWEKVEKILVPTERLVNDRLSLSEDLFFNSISEKAIREWIIKLIHFFVEEDATYLEINPFTIINRKVIPLGVVLVLDESAGFRHPDWEPFFKLIDNISTKTERERRIAEVDAQIKGSIKLVEVKQITGETQKNLTAMMGGGAGSALFLCDAILENDLVLANYAEFSGNPPDFAVAELTKQVCAIPGIKNLVIGSGIANFTPVVGNIKGIISGLRENPVAKKLNIVVRRCGPGEDEGNEMMKKFARESGLHIQVFGRETGMTEIVKKLTKFN